MYEDTPADSIVANSTTITTKRPNTDPIDDVAAESTKRARAYSPTITDDSDNESVDGMSDLDCDALDLYGKREAELTPDERAELLRTRADNGVAFSKRTSVNQLSPIMRRDWETQLEEYRAYIGRIKADGMASDVVARGLAAAGPITPVKMDQILGVPPNQGVPKYITGVRMSAEGALNKLKYNNKVRFACYNAGLINGRAVFFLNATNSNDVSVIHGEFFKTSMSTKYKSADKQPFTTLEFQFPQYSFTYGALMNWFQFVVREMATQYYAWKKTSTATGGNFTPYDRGMSPEVDPFFKQGNGSNTSGRKKQNIPIQRVFASLGENPPTMGRLFMSLKQRAVKYTVDNYDHFVPAADTKFDLPSVCYCLSNNHGFTLDRETGCVNLTLYVSSLIWIKVADK